MEFVSIKDIEKEKAERKNYLRDQLKQAEEEYRRKERAKLKRKERGEDTWMAPGLEKRLKYKDESRQEAEKEKEKKKDGEKSNKKKKEKKEKKSKKKKSKEKDKKHSKKKDESSSDSDSGGDQWVEADDGGKSSSDEGPPPAAEEAPSAPASTVQRDEWMMRPPPKDFLGMVTQREPEEKKEKVLQEDRPGQHARELNPYWKANATGLPEHVRERVAREQEERSAMLKPTVPADSEPKMSWRQKALARLQEGGASIPTATDQSSGPAPEMSVIGKSQYLASMRAQMKAPTSASVDMSWAETKGPSLEQTGRQAVSEAPMQPPPVEDKPPPAPEAPPRSPPPTAADLNKISAKILKAELMGDDGLVAQLKEKLEKMQQKMREPAESNQKAQPEEGKTEAQEKEVLFSAPDRHGNVRPLAHIPTIPELEKKGKRVPITHSQGQRDRYYENDDKVTLETMVETERYGDKHDYDYELVTNLANVNDSYDSDVFVGKKVDANKMMEKERTKAINAHRKVERIEETCGYCFDNKDIKKHLIVSVGYETYLALPSRASLTEYHCLIVPMQHVVSMNQLDENVQSEIKIMKKYLTKFFNSLDMDVIFMETAMGLSRHPHAYIEVIPLDRELGEMAPMYFKKAMQESMSEWATNRKIVKTQGRCPIPGGFAYFHVEFGTDGGFANPIEDEKGYPRYFGKEVAGGMMDVEPRMWMRPPNETFEQQKKKVTEFAGKWRPFDWTTTIGE
eukprot:comp22290_c0_seq1/m.33049 comp22290_c0_seq1/g.33049  ORF comp22290_c0_seq1/g.33049 comp22290_c0_seq1/m.33049 type:complete len:737 (-) comp22290_c0_seq1:175-2385(-)